MTGESDRATGISYSSELRYLGLAVKEQEEAHRLICREIEDFAPPSREDLIERLNIQYSTAPDPASLKEFIENQADVYLSNTSVQLTVEFSDRYAIRRTLSILVLHAYCEGLINTILAIALNHSKSPELFRALEMCSLIEKWEICPMAFSPQYRLDKSSAIYEDLKKLSKARNALTHHKIELRNAGGEIVIEGKFSGLSLDEKSRRETHRMFSLPTRLINNLNNFIDDSFLKFQISHLLR